MGYKYRPGWGCQRICPAGWYYAAGTCKKAGSHRCPANMFYSYELSRCVRKCGAGSYGSVSERRCKPRHW